MIFWCIAIKREEADYLNSFKFSLKHRKHKNNMHLYQTIYVCVATRETSQSGRKAVPTQPSIIQRQLHHLHTRYHDSHMISQRIQTRHHTRRFIITFSSSNTRQTHTTLARPSHPTTSASNIKHTIFNYNSQHMPVRLSPIMNYSCRKLTISIHKIIGHSIN